jgi:hypothetical protein
MVELLGRLLAALDMCLGLLLLLSIVLALMIGVPAIYFRIWGEISERLLDSSIVKVDPTKFVLLSFFFPLFLWEVFFQQAQN